MRQFIKIGTTCHFDDDGEINYSVLEKKVREIEDSVDQNGLVVSGAVKFGMMKEGETRPKSQLSALERQGYATVGQIELMKVYDQLFRKSVGQILVPDRVLEDITKLKDLIYHNIEQYRISLINYNDSVDFGQIFLDNDTHAARLVCACDADRLIILGTGDGFYNPEKKLIRRVSSLEQCHYDYCHAGTGEGNGGFEKRLDAAKILFDCGKYLITGNIRYPLQEIIDGKGTLFRKYND